MAERRMLSKSLLMDNRFLGISNDSKALYLYLLLFADDDGIVKRSMMIDSVLKVDDSNYNDLQKNGLIIPYDDQVKVITHWNNLQTIRADIYKQTTYLEFRSQLYIKSDYSYTKNANDKEVFSSADNWVKNGRPKDIKDFRPLINKYFQDRNGIRNDNRNGVRDVSKVKYSKDKFRLDKNSIDKSSPDQQRAERGSKDKYLNATTSSNGSMGENSSSSTSTSSLDNNATSESGENSEVNYLLDYANSLFTNGVPSDNERLNVQLTDLLNQYRPEFIKQALDNLAKQVGNNYPSQQIPTLLVGHLATTVKQVTVNQ